MTCVIKFEKTTTTAKAPTRATSGSAGFDLYADETFSLAPRERAAVVTGIRVAIPEGFEGQIRPRSGMASKDGITVLNSPGTIDSDYRGEVRVLLVNLSAYGKSIKQGERIAQLVIQKVPSVTFVEGTVADDTERGAGGFGSTGL